MNQEWEEIGTIVEEVRMTVGTTTVTMVIIMVTARARMTAAETKVITATIIEIKLRVFIQEFSSIIKIEHLYL